MFERAYRQRLDTDLTRWESDGIVPPATAAAIRGALPPLAQGVNIATVVAILGGLLIAAAFLAFIAANWTAIPRPWRFAILLAGIAASYGIGWYMAETKRTLLADLAVAVGSIVFGAAIALVGQMYHLGADFAGGMMLWALGALAAAAMTGSRGALAVALAAGCVWSGMRMEETGETPHLPFVAVWLIGAGLAVFWSSPVARHLTGVSALVWWAVTQIIIADQSSGDANAAALTAGTVLLLGAGLLCASAGAQSLRSFGLTLSTYGAFGLAAACAPIMLLPHAGKAEPEVWLTSCGVAGVVFAIAGAGIVRRAGPAFAAAAGALALIVASGLATPAGDGEPWLAYALLLVSMLSLVVSGMLDDVRPRIVAGWLGLALTVATITWMVRGSLLRRAVFLAIAGLAAVGLASLLGRLMPRERTS
jgi:uncharacterized membrane protein